MKFELKNAVMPLIVLNVIFFIIQFIIPDFTRAFLLVSSDIYTRPWILITHMFLHGSPYHLLFNMYYLFLDRCLSKELELIDSSLYILYPELSLHMFQALFISAL